MSGLVYKAKAGNQAPGPFSLTGPTDGDTVRTSTILSWEPSSDPDGDNLTYTILLSKNDAGFTDPIRIENLSENLYLVTEDDGLEDLATYYWKVQAIDEYGMITPSTETWSFDTNNTNPISGSVFGHVYDEDTLEPLPAAQVTVGSAEPMGVTGNGYYLFARAPGGYALTVTAGLCAAYEDSVTIGDGSVEERNIALTCPDPTDSDGDGIPDVVEDFYGCTDSDKRDSDNDGLDDGVEDVNHNGIKDAGETSPCLFDTDGDGMDDGWEVQYNLNPLVNDADDDQDHDGYTNRQEYDGGSDPTDPHSKPVKAMPFMLLLLDD